MTGWIELAAAFGVFFLSHSLPVRPPLRSRLMERLGPTGFTVLYSILSVAVLAWLIGAASRAPYVELWPRQPWQTYVPLLTMAPVCIIAAFAVGRANPFSFGGGSRTFDPGRPGVTRWLRHPLLVALALWAASHAVPNGDLAHVLLFGLFTGFALLGMRLVERRKRRQMGAEAYARLDALVRAGPIVPPPVSWRGAAGRLFAAGLAYAILLGLHPAIIGVSPLP